MLEINSQMLRLLATLNPTKVVHQAPDVVSRVMAQVKSAQHSQEIDDRHDNRFSRYSGLPMRAAKRLGRIVTGVSKRPDKDMGEKIDLSV